MPFGLCAAARDLYADTQPASAVHGIFRMAWGLMRNVAWNLQGSTYTRKTYPLRECSHYRSASILKLWLRAYLCGLSIASYSSVRTFLNPIDPYDSSGDPMGKVCFVMRWTVLHLRRGCHGLDLLHRRTISSPKAGMVSSSRAIGFSPNWQRGE